MTYTWSDPRQSKSSSKVKKTLISEISNRNQQRLELRLTKGSRDRTILIPLKIIFKDQKTFVFRNH